MSVPLYQSGGGSGGGSSAWSALTSAAGALSLSNAGFATTFNQTSAVIWTWGNTTAAVVGTPQNSPLIKLAGQYWTGAATAEDSWSIGSVLTAGTNGVSTLLVAHAGSTGGPQIQLPTPNALGVSVPQIIGPSGTSVGISIGGNAALPLVVASTTGTVDLIRCYLGGVLQGSIYAQSTSLSYQFSSRANASTVYIQTLGTPGATQTTAQVSLGHSPIQTWATTDSGVEHIGINCGRTIVAAGDTGPRLVWAPTAGTSTFTALLSESIVNQTSTASGSYTAIKANVVETALLGSAHLLLDLQAGVTGGVSRFKVDNSGQFTESSANGATWKQGQASELLTLSTVGLTTDTAANLLPANAIIEAVVCRITTTITTTTNWAVGDPTTAARFSAANATLTAGTTSVGIDCWSGAVTTLAAGPSQAAAAKVRITCTGANPGAGVIRITCFYRVFVAPTS